MEQPPPRRRSDALRRSPRTRLEGADRVRGFVHTAFAAGVGDDVGALTSSPPRNRIQLSGIALRLVVIILVVAALVVAVSIFSNRPTGASAIPSVSESAKTQEDESDSGAEGDGSAPNSNPDAAGIAPSAGLEESAAQLPGVDAGATQSPSVDAGTTQSPSELVIHVSGAVVSPGLVTLPAGSRVNDVVQEAGGLTPKADTVRINLAAVVFDAEHIHIPEVGEEVAPGSGGSGNSAAGGAQGAGSAGGSGGSAGGSGGPAGGSGGSAGGAASGLVNINVAGAAELETIPGVGPVTAQAIMTWRETNGSFSSVDQLIEVDGIGPKTLEKLRAHVTV